MNTGTRTLFRRPSAANGWNNSPGLWCFSTISTRAGEACPLSQRSDFPASHILDQPAPCASGALWIYIYVSAVNLGREAITGEVYAPILKLAYYPAFLWGLSCWICHFGLCLGMSHLNSVSDVGCHGAGYHVTKIGTVLGFWLTE